MLTGYIIANRRLDIETQLAMGIRSFGRSAGEAWRRHIRMDGRAELDFPIFVQRWSDKGYGPVAVVVQVAGRTALEEKQG